MRFSVLIYLLLLAPMCFAQDVNVLLKEGENFERSLKVAEALEKYKQAVGADANNINALIKAAELSASIGARQADKKAKKPFVDAARQYVDKALAIDPNNADANYVMSMVAARLTETETENKKIIENVKNIQVYAAKAVALNPNHARANFSLGKWHFEMVQLSWVKRVAVKTFFGGMPDATIEDAIKYMEKARSVDQYFVVNYLELAKAYKHDNKPAKAIEVLNKLVRLPNRTPDDAGYKAAGKKLLEEMQ
ncbi:hypothetical protein EXU57_03680 [Segetibacter sp. 3557_3]|uniref:tetratricopeptide repeat protein n=1 Tax=Segetibacter sp. 3557_3 TaxID=2547429 RepID=UPI001058B4D9|nr:hypothetical protein [Segetibacter sp. 3557_3]TDH29180.1 hypothetical protein EXU57_03680 [Segetibacter sp. 3557_3]